MTENRHTLQSRLRRQRWRALGLTSRGTKIIAKFDQKRKTKRIDLGIAILRAKAKPGERYSLGDIGAFADCSDEAIRLIEVAALAKLRPLMGNLSDY